MLCKQARNQIAALAQPAEAPPDLTQHTDGCEPCAKVLEERIALHNAVVRLREETAALGPSYRVEANILAALHEPTFKRHPLTQTWRWITVGAFGFAVLFLAAVVFTVSRTQKTPPVAAVQHDQPFTAMPYVVPPAPYERTAVIRTQISMQIMQSAGFEVHGEDLASTTLADVLYGEDGRILALRLVSQPNPTSEKRID